MIPSDGQVRWKCRRGMLELDTPLVRFCDQHLSSLSDDDRSTFFSMLQEEDMVWWDWLIEGKKPDNPEWIAMLARIK